MHDPDETNALFIGGRSGVGKSSVAYALSRLLAQADIAHVLIEGDNLSHAHPEPWRNGLPITEQNLSAMWVNYRAAGYRRLIYTNTVSVLEMDTLSTALGGRVRPIGVLLRARDATTAARLAKRESGASLREHVARSKLADARLKEAAPPSAHRVSTDGRTPEEIAAELFALTQWAGR